MKANTMFELPILGQRMLSERHCNQCGKCCEDIQLQPGSAAKFERMRAGAPDHAESLQIAKMLTFVGTWITPTSGEREHFTCKHYSKVDGNGHCGIHADRPRMCHGFPYYLDTPLLSDDMKQQFMLNNPWPSQYQGCTYNIDDQRPAGFYGGALYSTLKREKPLRWIYE